MKYWHGIVYDTQDTAFLPKPSSSTCTTTSTVYRCGDLIFYTDIKLLAVTE